MPFCFAPWTNIDISPQGDISPCCKFRYDQYQAGVPNLHTHTLHQYSAGSVLKSVQADFLQDRWPQGCERCRIEEENQVASKRQLDYQRWNTIYDKHDLNRSYTLTASVAFGNTCNLSCITCGPYSSSRWHNEYTQIYGKQIRPNHFYRQNFANDFFKSAPDLQHLDIPGGEPFISGVHEQQALLQLYRQSGQSRSMSLHYTTNAMVFPDSQWWEIWQDFDKVDIQLSIDGLDQRFEYIRYPASWSQLLHTLQRYRTEIVSRPNMQISISHTVSAYNIYYLGEFLEWCHAQQLPRPWLGRVHTPQHMRPTIWPLLVRQRIADHLRTYALPDANTWADMIEHNDDSDQYHEFLVRCRQHDNYRALDFVKTFPEIAKLAGISA